MLYSKTIFS